MPYKDYNNMMNEYMKKRWVKRRAMAVKHLGGVCVVCGTTNDLEFDHIDPSTKVCSVAKASSFSEVRFWEEVNKCRLLCRPHHLDRHYSGV